MLRKRGWVIAAGAVLVAASLGTSPGFGRQTTSDSPVQATTEHLATLHLGDCRQPQPQPAFTLGVVGPAQTDAGAPATAADVRGNLTTSPVLVGGGTVPIALGDLLDGGQPYALLVHATADDLTAPVACGEVGGVVSGGQLPLALRPLDRSGFAGVAVLGESEAGTVGTVLLFAEVDALERGDRGERVGRAGDGGRRAAPAGRVRADRGGNQGDLVITGGVDAPVSDGGTERTRTPRRQRTSTPTPTVPPGTSDVSGGGGGGTPPPGEPTATGTATTGEPTVNATATIPTEVAATEAVPTEAVPTEAVPTETVPTEGVPTEAVPTEPAATESPPADTAPTEVIEPEPTPVTDSAAGTDGTAPDSPAADAPIEEVAPTPAE